MSATPMHPSPAAEAASATAASASPVLLRIGEAAEQAGTSCRTLRYYEELGLLRPSGHSPGGARRYTEEDVGRLRRIRELQELLGFDLGEIGDILRGEDQLAELRDEYRAGAGTARRRQILTEAMAINDRLRSMVQAKQQRLQSMMQELEEKAELYRSRVAELGATRPEGSGPAARAGGTTPASPGAPHRGAPGRRPPA